MSAGSGATTVFLRDPNHSRSYVNFIRGIGEAKTKHVRDANTARAGGKRSLSSGTGLCADFFRTAQTTACSALLLVDAYP